METARWRAERHGPIAFDDAVELAGHWLKDWPGTVNFEDLRDWLVASFFTIAGGHQPPLVDGDTYRLLDKDTNLDAVRLDENVVAQCIEKAASSGIHHDALRKAGVLLLRNGQLLGDALSRWVAADYEGSLPRCRKLPKGKNALRDRAIVATIKRLEAEGMNATRNATSSRPISACDAIASATNERVTYEAAVSAWKNRAR